MTNWPSDSIFRNNGVLFYFMAMDKSNK